ncbi:MAG: BatD family protein [Planctomycetes bacterium]|nr:BatD family protein [Planctomycetota bacterium]
MSRFVLLLAALLWARPPSFAAGAAPRATVADAEAPPFVARLVAPARAFVGEPIEVALLLEWDAAWFADHALQPFQQPLDLPLQVEGAPLRERPEALARAPDFARSARGGGADAWTLVVDGERVAATATPIEPPSGATGANDANDGAGGAPRTRWRRLRLAREFLADRAGPFVLPAAAVAFATTRGFREDLLGTRTPIDRQEQRVVVPGATVEVVDWPTPQRPAAFAGAVGSLRVSLDATPRELAVGETVRVVVRVAGRGNFERIEAPPYVPDGFESRGVLRRASATGLELTYDLVPTAITANQLPPWRLAALDPGPPARYVELATPPLRLEVAPPADAAAEAERAAAAAARAKAFAELALLAPLREVVAEPGLRSSVAARAELGLRACRDGDFAAAEAWFAAALDEPDAPRGPLWFNRGHARFAQGDALGALAAWLVAARELPGDRDLAANVAWAAERLALPDSVRRELAERVRRGGPPASNAPRLALLARRIALQAIPASTARATPPAAPRGEWPAGTLVTIEAEGIRFAAVRIDDERGYVERAALRALD